MDPPEDAVLWSLGDRESFGVLFERHAEAVWNHAYRLTGSWDQARVVTSATFLTAWRTRAEITPRGDSTLPLLYTMAGNASRAARRGSTRRSRLPRTIPAPTPIDDHADADAVVHRIDSRTRLREVVDAIRLLPEAQRQAAELCLLGAVPVAEAAAHLDIDEATVRSHLSSARDRLPDLSEDATGTIALLASPPPRALPPELRARLRADVDQGLDGRRPRKSLRGPVVAAAALVLLAGTIVVLRQAPNDTAKPVVNGPALNQEVATAAMDRCWKAVQQRGMADRFPDRSRWTPSFTAGDSQVGVVAARADGKPLFCQTTPTTATVTDPNAAPDSGTAAVLFSREGVVAGVSDVTWDRIALKGIGPHGGIGLSAVTGDHMFIARTGTNLAGAAISINEIGSDDPTAVRALAAPAPPAVLARDHPDGPAPDRTSDAGRALGDCLARSSRPLLDPDSYQLGASVSHPGGVLVLGRSTDSLVVCRADQEKTEAARKPLVNGGVPAVLTVTEFVGDRMIVGGEVAAEVATIDIGLDSDPPQPAAVVNRTFAFLVPVIPEQPAPGVGKTVDLHAIVRDANGVTIFEKSWNLFR